jgi:ubiquinone/menaquinone biosynthesis C-methylase UbiE
MVNYFADGMDAARYARSRPNIHPTAIEAFKSFTRPDRPFPLALDAGCGTGQSTVAVAGLAERAIGIDPSPDMLKHAARCTNVEYCRSVAETTPFRDRQFDLVAAGQSFHWFQHDAFLAESYRLLRKGGWLLVYTSWFTGEMCCQPAFLDWFKEEYLCRYPTPPRNRNPLTEGLARKHGLVLRGQDEFTNQLSMTVARFTDYQLSTTNIIAAVRRRGESYEGAARWIRVSVAQFFAGRAKKDFVFTGKTWYVQKPT